jgi:hypothetical protein
MRNLIFVFVALLSVVGFSVVGISGCGDSGGGGTTGTIVKDLSVKPPADLTQPPNGCNGLLACLQACASGDTNCENDCVAGGTDHALQLFNQAFFFCPATKFCGPGTHSDAGAGGQACNSTDLDPTVTFAPPNFSQPTDECNACLDEFFAGSMASTQFQSKCMSDLAACQNDKP